MKPLILGEAPGKPFIDKQGAQMNDFPLSGKVARHLMKLYDDSYEFPDSYPGEPLWRAYYWPLLLRFDLENVLTKYPGTTEEGRPAFPMSAAVAAVVGMEHYDPGRTVVVCGRRVAEAMDRADASTWKHEWFKWFFWRSWTCAMIPHPSGLNRLYNDAEVCAKAGDVLHRAVRLAEEAGS